MAQGAKSAVMSLKSRFYWIDLVRALRRPCGAPLTTTTTVKGDQLVVPLVLVVMLMVTEMMTMMMVAMVALPVSMAIVIVTTRSGL